MNSYITIKLRGKVWLMPKRNPLREEITRY